MKKGTYRVYIRKSEDVRDLPIFTSRSSTQSIKCEMLLRSVTKVTKTFL